MIDTCIGCKHNGKWENEIEYGCSSPCTRCKRRCHDNYETNVIEIKSNEIEEEDDLDFENLDIDMEDIK